MDTVRFGRILGTGARHAAKTLLSAADAAASPNPRSAQAGTPVPRSPHTSPPDILPPVSARTPPGSVMQRTVSSAQGIAEGSRRFGRAVWAPTLRLSGVLWLEVTGVFFALFALVATIAAWNLLPGLRTSALPTDRTHFFFAVGMILVFGYFSLSSFLKARRRSRQP